jgi:hypothetical protein
VFKCEPGEDNSSGFWPFSGGQKKRWGSQPVASNSVTWHFFWRQTFKTLFFNSSHSEIGKLKNKVLVYQKFALPKKKQKISGQTQKINKAKQTRKENHKENLTSIIILHPFRPTPPPLPTSSPFFL